MKFMTLAVKVALNVHDLNNEATAGNVSDIRMIDYVDLNGQRREAPAVSGRMLKHWHFEHLRKSCLADPDKLPLCDGCRAGEPIRPGEGEPGKIVQVARAEPEAVSRCVVCDLHGYLIAQQAKGAAKGVSTRRTSRALFSWLMPCLDSEATSRQVVHTRVSQQAEMTAGSEKEQSAQMLFYKSYASALYGFVSALDAGRVGFLDSAQTPAEGVDAAARVKAAVEAYRPLLTGQLGASLSHAMPHADVLEVLVAVSDTGPLPFPVSPIYPGYAAKYGGLVPTGTTLHVFGIASTPEGATSHETLNALFAAIGAAV